MRLETSGYYRGIAQKMIKEANKTADDEEREGFHTLAWSWMDLADQVDACGRGMRLEPSVYYRSLAQRMINQAKRTSDDGERNRFHALAASWLALADQVELNGRGERLAS